MHLEDYAQITLMHQLHIVGLLVVAKNAGLLCSKIIWDGKFDL